MTEHAIPECLFIGGTADGERIAIYDTSSKHHIRSLADITQVPHALEDGDPRPETMPVTEIYVPCEVDHGNRKETVYVLNALTDAAITMQLVKHFGAGVTFRRMAAV